MIELKPRHRSVLNAVDDLIRRCDERHLKLAAVEMSRDAYERLWDDMRMTLPTFLSRPETMNYQGVAFFRGTRFGGLKMEPLFGDDGRLGDYTVEID